MLKSATYTACDLGRYWRTIRHLRPTQVSNRLSRALPWRGRHRLGAGSLAARRAPAQAWRPLAGNRLTQPSTDLFSLLHRTHAWPARPDAALAPPRLWRYHAHYFEDLFDPHFARRVARWLKEDWHASNEAWEPYPLSRRIPHWIQWLLAGNEPVPGMVESLAAQTISLHNQIEHHLQANHLLANWRALVFAECFFAPLDWSSTDAPSAAAEWTRELERQMLADGGHEERSPMYHALILQDLLDLIQLAGCYPSAISRETQAHWRARAAGMLGWLRMLTHPDGGIAFFQDTAFGMAADPPALTRAAASLGIEPVSTLLDSSGYARIEQAGTVLMVDVGSPGPGHQPGHAHAGALSFELSHGGHRFFVNSGVSTYEPGPTRTWERSTAAHNTLRLNGRDQSEMWAAFRLGRRAKVARLDAGDSNVIAARHDGYAPVRHERRFTRRPGELLIEDTLRDTSRPDTSRQSAPVTAELFFHCHPLINVDRRTLECRHPSGASLRVEVPGRWRVEETTWRPEFGLEVPNLTIRVEHDGPLPALLATRMHLR
jgi:uncharacterized heparinase superfamily protein